LGNKLQEVNIGENIQIYILNIISKFSIFYLPKMINIKYLSRISLAYRMRSLTTLATSSYTFSAAQQRISLCSQSSWHRFIYGPSYRPMAILGPISG